MRTFVPRKKVLNQSMVFVSHTTLLCYSICLFIIVTDKFYNYVYNDSYNNYPQHMFNS